MNAVSLFAGIEGIGLGLERQGIKVACQVEWDAAASRVLAHHFPDVPRFTDVREVTADDVRAAVRGPVDVLTGGFPCQDVSVAGRRAGVAEGTRSGLYRELVRLAETLAPEWLVVENVPGLLSADDGRAFALVLGDLTGWEPAVPEDGWRSSGVCVGPLRSAAWRVLDAQHFGVAQRRRRVFIVCHARDRAAPAAVLLEPEGVRGNPPPGGTSWARAADGAAGGPHRIVNALSRSGVANPDDNSAQGGHLVVAPALTARYGKGTDSDATDALCITGQVTHAFTSEGADASEDGTGRGTPIAFHVTQDPISGQVSPALGRESTAGVMTFAKRRRAGAHDDSPESWTETETAPTIDACGQGPRTATAVVTPIELRNALRDHGRTGVGTPGTGIGNAGDPVGTLGTAPLQAVAVEALAIRGREGGAQAETGGDLMFTLRAGDGSSSRQPLARVESAVRRLTPRECERLQGFPDDWTLIPSTSDSARYRQLGNAVCVNVSEWIGWRLAAYQNGWRP